jgi:hypothetical protein
VKVHANKHECPVLNVTNGAAKIRASIFLLVSTFSIMITTIEGHKLACEAVSHLGKQTLFVFSVKGVLSVLNY